MSTDSFTSTNITYPHRISSNMNGLSISFNKNDLLDLHAKMTSLSPLNQFALISPSSVSAPIQHPFTEAYSPSNESSDGNSFPISNFSSPSENFSNLMISKRLQSTITKLVRNNRDLRAKLLSLEAKSCDSKNEEKILFSSAKIKEKNNGNNEVVQVERNETKNIVTPRNSTEHVASNMIPDEKDLQIISLEADIIKLKAELEEQKRVSMIEKKQIETELTNTIHEIRRGTLTVLVNTKKQVHELLREVEEYKLRSMKMSANETNFNGIYQDTVNLIEKETKEHSIYTETTSKYYTSTSCEEKVDNDYEFETQAYSYDDYESTHVQKLTQKIIIMGAEIKRLRERQGLKQDGYTIPEFQTFDEEDVEYFEDRDSHENTNSVKYIEVNGEKAGLRDDCLMPLNFSSSLSITDSNDHINHLVSECNKYQQEAYMSKCKVAELALENKECLERLACVGTELLGTKVSKRGRRAKAQKNRLLAVAQAAGDLESIRKKKMDDTDSLANHTGHSETDSAVKIEVVPVSNKVIETKIDASEKDSFLKNGRGKWRTTPKKKKSKIFLKRKTKTKSLFKKSVSSP